MTAGGLPVAIRVSEQLRITTPIRSAHRSRIEAHENQLILTAAGFETCKTLHWEIVATAVARLSTLQAL